jgi:DHA3 family macrolide efflux protein-like MFS transporter
MVSQAGDKFYMLALSFMVLETTGSVSKMGIALFAGMLPLVTTGLFAGVVVDRVNRKKIIIITDILRGIIVSFVSLLYAHGSLTFGMILLSQVLLGINSAFFNPAIPSVIPMIVEEEDLSKANAKTQFVSGFSNIIGPSIGGILVSLHGYFIVFVLNAFSYFASALFECFLKIPSVKANPQERLSIAFKEGYRYIYSDQKLLIILFMVFIVHFFVGSIEVAIPVIANLLPGRGAANMGYIQTTFGAGAVLMALFLSYISISGRESFMLFMAVAFIGLYLFFIGLAGLTVSYLLIFLILFLLFSASIILAGTSFQSLIQKNTDAEMTGRVFGVVSSVGNFSIPFAMLVYGFLLDSFNSYILLSISGLMTILVTAIASWLYKKTGRKETTL